jgi:site-specific DNA-methyltransferase (adenine-specific)
MREWNSPCFVNPPYSEILPWMEKAALEARAGKTVVLLVPARTDTRWWHEFAMKAKEIRFIRGRLKFGNAKTGAPFPSAVVVFGPTGEST